MAPICVRKDTDELKFNIVIDYVILNINKLHLFCAKYRPGWTIVCAATTKQEQFHNTSYCDLNS